MEVFQKVNVGGKIKELRKRRGLTTTELAKKINVSQSTISLYENGKREPDFKTITKIANTLNVQPVIFFGDFNEDEEVLDLETLLRSRKLTWGPEVLDEDEKERAIEVLKILLTKKKDTN